MSDISSKSPLQDLDLVILRQIFFMDSADNTTYLLRGWRESLAVDPRLNFAQRQGFSRTIEKYVLAGEQRGWVLGVESAKRYIGLVEEKRLGGVRWEEGREGLRWLMGFMKKGVEVDHGERWQVQMEKRLRERQYAERTVETLGKL